jgi:hypothetical protein
MPSNAALHSRPMAKTKRGRVTPPRAAAAPTPSPRRVRLPDGSRSVQSPWVWRGFAFMSLLALGLCIGLFAAGHTGFAAAWAVITLGWFSVAMWLWRQHVRDDST